MRNQRRALEQTEVCRALDTVLPATGTALASQHLLIPSSSANTNFPLARCGQVTESWTLGPGSTVVQDVGVKRHPQGRRRPSICPILFLCQSMNKGPEVCAAILDCASIQCWSHMRLVTPGL